MELKLHKAGVYVAGVVEAEYNPNKNLTFKAHLDTNGKGFNARITAGINIFKK